MVVNILLFCLISYIIMIMIACTGNILDAIKLLFMTIIIYIGGFAIFVFVWGTLIYLICHLFS